MSQAARKLAAVAKYRLMATAVQQITLARSRDIPFNKLTLSPDRPLSWIPSASIGSPEAATRLFAMS
jgi:hypothetical protein